MSLRAPWMIWIVGCLLWSTAWSAPPLRRVDTRQAPRPAGGDRSVELLYNPQRVHVRVRLGRQVHDLGIHPEKVEFADWARGKAYIVGAVFQNVDPARLEAAQKTLARASEAAVRWGLPLYDLLGEDLRLRKVSARELSALKKAPRARELFREGIDGDERQMQMARMHVDVLPQVPKGYSAYHIDKDALSNRQGYMYPPGAWRAKGYVVAKEVREGEQRFLEAPNGWRVPVKGRVSANELTMGSQSCVSFAVDALAEQFPETGLGALRGEQRTMTYGLVEALFRDKSAVKADAMTLYYPGEMTAEQQARLLKDLGEREKPPRPLAEQGLD